MLPTLPDASVQCVVTSPPYFGLRDYQTGTWEGGDAACDHDARRSSVHFARKNSAEFVYRAGNGGEVFRSGSRYIHQGNVDTSRQCSCGARRIDAQIGLEATPEAFIAELVAVFRQVRRVMRDDAVAFVNLGDSYQDKQLQMIPSRVALALQADGWWLRSDIVWAKPNPMPESCRDRPTSAHEHVFLLTKRARYYYDADAVREVTGSEMSWDDYAVKTAPGATWPSGGITQYAGTYKKDGGQSHPSGRNLRNVWTIATAPFPAAHFATFPPELAERCIRAGTSERGCCAACGAPWVRVTERTAMVIDRSERTHPMGRTRSSGTMLEPPTSTTTGWSPSCTCNAETRPCVVLDPFSGAGTALLVADRLGRDAIGIDLSHAYVEMARERLRADCPLFADISPPPAEAPAEAGGMADLFEMAAD